MITLIPKGQTEEATSTPLEVTKTKEAAMLKKCKELHTKIMTSEEMMKLLNEYYIFEKNEHYTKAQLMKPIDALYLELNPVEEEEEEDNIITD